MALNPPTPASLITLSDPPVSMISALPKPDQVEGFHDRIGGRCAGADHGKIWAAETMTHGNMPCSNIEDHFRNEERIETRSAIAFGEIHHFFLESDESTDAAGKHNTYTVWIEVSTVVIPASFDGFIACSQGLFV